MRRTLDVYGPTILFIEIISHFDIFVFQISLDYEIFILLVFSGNGECLQQTVMNKLTKGFQFGDHAFTLKLEPSPIIILFPSNTGNYHCM